jgi:hypothetical protein
MWAFDRRITVVFIRIDVRAFAGEPLYMRPQGRLLGVGHHPQSHLTGQPPDCPEYRRAVIGEGTTPTSFIGPRARRVSWVEMLAAFLTGILEHFVTFSVPISKWCGRLDSFGLGLEPMAPFQDSLFGQFEFTGQLSARLALKHAT